MKVLYILMASLLTIVMMSCESTNFSTTNDDSPPPVIVEPPVVDEEEDPPEEKIYIVDRTGKQWDITHAVNVYNFRADGFQFGLGPHAIKPIINPEMLSPGDPDYPAPNETQIIGATINGDTRAYPLDLLRFNEIANDSFGGIPVAVGF